MPSNYRKVDTNEFQEAPETTADGLEKEFPGGRKQRNLGTLTHWLYAFMALCAVLIVVGMGYGFQKSHQHHDASESLISTSGPSPCGNSSAEALSLGCTFDQLMWAWYPPHCSHYANDEFVHAEPEAPWTYYDGLHHGKAVRPEDENWVEILDSGIQLWGERREHLAHCVYMFLSAGQIIWGDDGKFVPKLVSSEHFNHCVGILMDALRQDNKWFSIETSVPRPSFESCSTL